MKLIIGLLLLISTSQVYADRVRGTRSNGKSPRSLDGSSRHLGGKGKGGSKQSDRCGCSGCTDTVWNRDAGDFKCGARIEYLQAAWADTYPTEKDACRRVAGTEFPDICGPCDPASCGAATAGDRDETYCGCPECTKGIWDLDADDYSCGARITWLLENDSGNYPTEEDACRLVAGNQFPAICGTKCNPDTCNPSPGPTRCGCPKCNQEALEVIAGGFSCGFRIDFVMGDIANFPTEVDACRQVAFEFPDVCGPVCNPNECSP